MKLDAVATLGARLWQLHSRDEVGAQAAAGLIEAFESDGALVWLADHHHTSCEADDLFVAGTLLQAAAKADIALAIRSGRLQQWIAARGGAIFNGTELGSDDESSGLIAVAWRHARRMPGYVDAFLMLVAEQLKALLEREAVIESFGAQPRPAREGAAIRPNSLRIVARGDGMGALLEQAPDAVILHNLRGKILDANVVACTLLGCPRREIIGTNLASLMMNSSTLRQPWLRPNFAEAARVKTEYLLRRRDGRPLRLNASTRVVQAQGERIAVMFGRESTDGAASSAERRAPSVIAPKRSARATPVTTALARSIVESTGDLIFAKDAQGRYVQANPAFCAVVGRSLSDVVGRADGDLLAADAAEAFRAVDARVLKSGRTATHEVTIAVDGQPRRFHVRHTPWRDDERNLIGVVGVASDVTGRRDAERQHEVLLQELTGANERTERMLAEQRRMTDRAAALLGIARTLGAGLDAERARAVALAAIDQHIPQAACAIASYDPITHEARITAYGRDSDLLRIDHDTFRGDDASFGDDLQRGCTFVRMRLGPSDFAIDTLLRDRGARGLAAVPLLLGGRPGGLLLIAWRQGREPQMEDVSLVENVAAHLAQALENARLYAELKESLASLRSAQDQVVRTQRLRALGEMAAGVAHDFNNSLTTILGLTEWLLHSLPAENEVRGDLGTIRTAAMDAAAIVRRLQMFGKSVPHTTSAEPVNLAEVAALIPDMVRPRIVERQERDGARFDLVVEASPVPLVRAVQAEIRELLLNLVLNAIDAMPRGGRITLRTRPARGGTQVSVTDEGVGMTEEIKRRVFEPFFTTKGHAGNGLGLSVCWGIAERHGGTLTVDSAPDEGATFTLTLPAAGARPAPEPRKAAAPAPPVVRDLKVLLVDDQADVRESVADMLGALGHQVTPVDRGSAALERLAEQPYDLVITDLGMAGMNGLELAHQCRAAWPALPIVLLTGWGAEYESDPPEEVSLVLAKPVTLRALREAVAAAVHAGGGHGVAERTG